MHVVLRIKNLQQLEDPFELLLHRFAQAMFNGIGGIVERATERAEHLIRTVVPHDLGGQHGLNQLAIRRAIGMCLAKPVERRDRVIAKHDVTIEHAFGQYRLGRSRADRL